MSARYWDPQVETLPSKRRHLLRDHRLRWQVRRCWDGSPFYRALLEAAGLDAASFGGLADLHRFPILRPADLPTGPDPDRADASWTVAPAAWWQDVSHDGPRFARALTDGDIIHRTDLAARALWAAGGRASGTLALAGTSDDDVAGLIVGASARIGMTISERGDEAQLAAGERVRATINASDQASTELAWRFAWPSVADRGTPSGCALSLRHVTPTVAYTCGKGDGVHWADDHFLVEIVDLVTAQRLGPGVTGAVVVTDLTREGSPLLRLWTGLLAGFIDEPCPCGRTSARSPFVRPLT